MGLDHAQLSPHKKVHNQIITSAQLYSNNQINQVFLWDTVLFLNIKYKYFTGVKIQTQLRMKLLKKK